MRKCNEKMLMRASDVAHGMFWLSDSLQVIDMARDELTKHMQNSTAKYTLADYVSYICWACSQVSNKEEEERNKKYIKNLKKRHETKLNKFTEHLQFK